MLETTWTQEPDSPLKSLPSKQTTQSTTKGITAMEKMKHRDCVIGSQYLGSFWRCYAPHLLVLFISIYINNIHLM